MSHSGIAYQVVTDKIIAALDQGYVPWQQPWKPGQGPTRMTGEPYQGINVFLLQLAAWEKGYESKYWMTFNQMTELGGSLKVISEDQREPGDKSKTGQQTTKIIWWSLVRDRRSEDPKAVFPVVKFYRVFNMDQTEGVRLPKRVRELEAELESLYDGMTPNEIGDAIIEGYLANGGPKLFHTDDARAFYDMDKDAVNLPDPTVFKSADAYYDAAFHELVHSTGHKSREDRLEPTHFGSEKYSREELTAQMGAVFLDSLAGIESTFDNSVSYIAGWRQKLIDDPKALVSAASKAQHAVNRMVGQPVTPDDVREPDAAGGAGNEPAGVLVEQ